MAVDLTLIPTTTCPACGSRKGRTMLACRDCWRRIPTHLRRAVNHALAEWFDEPDTDEDAGRLGSLRAAQAEALAAGAPDGRP